MGQDPSIKMVVFDVDGTLIVHPSGKVVWQVLNQRYGTPPEINLKRYYDVRDGRMTYPEWVQLDVGDWQKAGATREDILCALREFQMVDGVVETLVELERRGYRLAAVSGTIDILVDTIFPDHPFERLYLNRIFFDAKGQISGWEPTPFDFDGKARALEVLSRETSIALAQMAFVGDDVNDVGAIRAAGLGVAFRPRSPELAEVCDVEIPQGPMTQLLDILH